MNDDEDRLLYLCLGPVAAIGLGCALVPLRALTVASNLTFAFLALTFAVGELGGRLPALATALVSALSLDFFLTRPYLRLAMHDKNDLVAFLGLAGCGLLAAFLGGPRRERDSARRRLEFVDRALRQIEGAGPVGARLQAVAEAAGRALPISSVAVRDDQGALLATFGRTGGSGAEPGTVVGSAEVTLPESWDWRVKNTPLPSEGLRVTLVARARPVGSLDIWGNGRPASRDARRAIGALAPVLAAILDTARPARGEPTREPLWTVGGRRG